MRNAAVIVAHPDDETLWAGGTILAHPKWNWTIFCLSRRDDPDRAPRFYKTLEHYRVSGGMENLDHEQSQRPIEVSEVKRTILSLTGEYPIYDLIITHGPKGEYTRHLRHEEVCAAVTEMWMEGYLDSEELWFFAYEDGEGRYFPKPQKGSEYFFLPQGIWTEKRQIIEEIYGFRPDSWESRAAPRIEGFWKFKNRSVLRQWLKGGVKS